MPVQVPMALQVIDNARVSLVNGLAFWRPR
jgi:hypothetical protein